MAERSSLQRDLTSRRIELGNFLKARRAEVSPLRVGLPDSGVRRTAGLRREEVALLASVGVSWYTWIEQGRAANVSGDVLDSIARVLQLDETQRRYVRRLAGVSTEHHTPASNLSPGAFHPFVDNWLPNPAYIADRYWNVMIANDSARFLLGIDDGSWNIIRAFFLNDNARTLYPLWDEDAPEIVARFRDQVASYADDSQLAAIVDQLRMDSSEFAELWERHDVVEDSCGTELLYHREIGKLSFTRATLDFTSRLSLRMTVFLPISGTGTDEGVDKMARVIREQNSASLTSFVA